MEQVELRSSLLLVTDLDPIREELVQPQYRSIGDDYVSKQVDISVNNVGNSDLVKRAVERRLPA